MFNSSLWKGDVLQISTQEPAIRYAMLAASAMHEGELLKEQGKEVAKPLKDFALNSYNQAIRCLVEQSRTNTISMPILMSACLLFVCIEIMRREVNAALTHIHSGISILGQWRTKQARRSPAFRARMTPLEISFVEEQLVPMIAWLSVFASRFGRPFTSIWVNSPEDASEIIVGEINSVLNASTQMSDMTTACINLHTGVKDTKYAGLIDDQSRDLQRRLILACDDWKNKVDIYLLTQTSDLNFHDNINTIMLMSLFYCLRPNIMMALEPGECGWDNYKSDWEKVYTYSEQVFRACLQYADRLAQKFTLEMTVVGQLNMIVRKCRWPELRHKALKLLKACLDYEIFDQTFHAWITAKRMMEIEEAATEPGELLPPEKARIHHFLYDAENSTREKHWIMFLYKPDGLAAPWQVIRECVDVGEMGAQVEVGNMKYPGLPEESSDVQERKHWEPTLPLLLVDRADGQEREEQRRQSLVETVETLNMGPLTTIDPSLLGGRS